MAIGEKTISAHGIQYFSATYDAPNLTTVTTTDNAVTVTGVRYNATAALLQDRVVAVIPPAALNHGVFVQSARVTADDTITVRLSNMTGSDINPASGTWEFLVARF